LIDSRQRLFGDFCAALCCQPDAAGSYGRVQGAIALVPVVVLPGESDRTTKLSKALKWFQRERSGAVGPAKSEWKERGLGSHRRLFLLYKIEARFTWNSYPRRYTYLPKENPYVPNFSFGSNDHLDLRGGRRRRKGSLGGLGDGISLPEISTRGTLHAWSWPEMVRKTRAAFHAEF
jgi:hypothetical protein